MAPLPRVHQQTNRRGTVYRGNYGEEACVTYLSENGSLLQKGVPGDDKDKEVFSKLNVNLSVNLLILDLV